jgi:hypothetical protein
VICFDATRESLTAVLSCAPYFNPNHRPEGFMAPTIDKYFAFPAYSAVMKALPDMTGAELKLYVSLWSEANRCTRNDFELSAKDVHKLTGLSAGAVKSAREALCGRGFIQVEDSGKLAIPRYVLCHPETKIPLSGRSQMLVERKQRQNFDAEFLEGKNSERRTIQGNRRDVFHLTRDECRRYYEARLKQKLDGDREWSPAHCPFHEDTHPSLSIKLASGNWHCHGCRDQDANHGGIVKFEQRLSKCTVRDAIKNIARLSGAEDIVWPTRKRIPKMPEASYPYLDEKGNVLFLTFRFPGKQFRVARPGEQGQLTWNKGDVREVLYNLPSVIAARTVIICEGEKDADRVSSLQLLDSDGKPVAVTTNPFGAGKWRDEFSKVLAGKRVVILPDIDEPDENDSWAGIGWKHACQVRDSVQKYAAEVRLVEFDYSDFGDGDISGDISGDVSDFLDHHSVEELKQKIGQDWFIQYPQGVAGSLLSTSSYIPTT